MCGISGIIRLKNTGRPLGREAKDDMYKMVKAQFHRGPDDQGVCGFSFDKDFLYEAHDAFGLPDEAHFDGILGFNRLSIKDLSLAGHQPMVSSEGRTVIVFNGEIYNDAALRQELTKKGYSFKSRTDTEVILNLYLEYGIEKMLAKLNGMFAFAIVDLRKKRICLARDRFGIKPLYYSVYNNKLVFASELKCMTQIRDFPREIDERAANARLVFARAGNYVLLKNTHLLEPGCVLTGAFDGDIRKEKFFELDAYTERSAGKYRNIREAMEEAEELLSGAVSRQMVSDVKVGCQLSGGIDSTLVTWYANQLASDNLNDAVSIIDEKGVIGEEEYIDRVGGELNLQLHKFHLSEDYFMDNYERMIWHNDAPVYQPYFICFMKLAEDAKKYVTVLLSGEGSDEIAGGYSRFAGGYLYPFVKKLGSSRGAVQSYASYAHYAVMAGETITDFLTSDCHSADSLIQERVDVFNRFTGTDFTKHLKFEMAECLPEALLRQDKMTMASSIENRVPLLDNEVVDFVMQLPEEMLVAFGDRSPVNLSDDPFEWMQGKYLFKEIIADKFGHDFAYRKKQIMALDKRAMVSSSRFREYYGDMICRSMRQRGLVDAKKVDDWFKHIHEITNKEFNSMWRAISLETWCQLFLDGRTCI